MKNTVLLFSMAVILIAAGAGAADVTPADLSTIVFTVY